LVDIVRLVLIQIAYIAIAIYSFIKKSGSSLTLISV